VASFPSLKWKADWNDIGAITAAFIALEMRVWACLQSLKCQNSARSSIGSFVNDARAIDQWSRRTHALARDGH